MVTLGSDLSKCPFQVEGLLEVPLGLPVLLVPLVEEEEEELALQPQRLTITH